MRVYLDMDGVLVDFVGGICKAHNRPSPYLDTRNHGVYDTEKIWGITPQEFWKPAEDDENFWVNLNKTAEADGIVKLLSDYCGEENIAILTSPAFHSNCQKHKKTWIKHYYPQFAKNVIFAQRKELLAHPNALLVDDKDTNIMSFIKYGGNAITIPRPWNSEYRRSKEVLTVLEDALYYDITRLPGVISQYANSITYYEEGGDR